MMCTCHQRILQEGAHRAQESIGALALICGPAHDAVLRQPYGAHTLTRRGRLRPGALRLLLGGLHPFHMRHAY